MVKDPVVARPSASSAVASKALWPSPVGMPAISPEVDSVSPAGSAPDERDQLRGGVPLSAERCCSYATPTTPSASAPVTTLGGQAALLPASQDGGGGVWSQPDARANAATAASHHTLLVPTATIPAATR